MYATLAEYLAMSPADRAKVTHLDASIVDAQDEYRVPIYSAFDGIGLQGISELEEDPYQ